MKSRSHCVMSMSHFILSFQFRSHMNKVSLAVNVFCDCILVEIKVVS